MAAQNYRVRGRRTVKSRPKRRRRLPLPCKPAPMAREELLEILSKRLALVETCAAALHTIEDDPQVGPVSQALDQATELLGKAHEAVGHFVQGVRS
jgi:hypothetical protein